MNRPRLLIVEDDPDFGESLSGLLEDSGFEASIAGSVRAGREQLARLRPDVVLIDVNLPDGAGIDLLDSLPETAPGALGIVLTGNASIGSAVEALNRGAYAYLLKDSAVEEILSVVRRAAEHAQLARENDRLASELSDSERKYRDLIENSPDMIHVLDREGRFVDSNRTEERLLGIPRAELRSKTLLELVAEPFRERTRAHLDRVAQTGHDRVETQLLTRSGETIDVDMHSTAQRDSATGLVSHTRCFLRDISEWKRVQRTLVEKERLASVGQMAATIAHEVRNPLAGISGAIQVISADFASDPEKTQIVKEILTRIDRLNAIIGDLLTFARPLVPSFRPVTFCQIMSGVLSVLAKDPSLREIEFDVHDDTDGASFRWDPALLDLAFTNLLLNGAQAMKGKGRIRISARWAGGSKIIVSLEDGGPGLSADTLSRIFAPFFTTKVKGTGLGLAVTRKVMEAHHGSIEIRNRPAAEGTGAIVEMTLPAACGNAN